MLSHGESSGPGCPVLHDRHMYLLMEIGRAGTAGLVHVQLYGPVDDSGMWYAYGEWRRVTDSGNPRPKVAHA